MALFVPGLLRLEALGLSSDFPLLLEAFMTSPLSASAELLSVRQFNEIGMHSSWTYIQSTSKYITPLISADWMPEFQPSLFFFWHFKDFASGINRTEMGGTTPLWYMSIFGYLVLGFKW